MVLKVATRGQVPPFIVMDVMRAAAAREASGASVLHLEVGQPGGNAPQAALDAGIEALRQGRVAYTDALGIPALREGIAKHYRDFYGLSIAAERIAVTTGSSGAFILSFLASFDAGDRVALAAPGYPAYRNILKALDIEPVLLETDLEHRFQPTPELLDAAGRLDGLIVASPANPTGTVLSTEALGALARHCRTKGIRLVSDEIYHGITYGQKVATAAALDDEAIVVNSFSKYFSMTGWRLGWLVLPKSLLRAVECLAQNFFISPPAVSQMAGLAALNCYEELDAKVAGYAKNRAILLERLPQAGIDKMAPADGAFYIYADIGHLTNDSPEFCRRALEEIGVAMTPGTDFDPARGHRTLRISFAGKEAEIDEAARRLIAWIKK